MSTRFVCEVQRGEMTHLTDMQVEQGVGPEVHRRIAFREIDRDVVSSHKLLVRETIERGGEEAKRSLKVLVIDEWLPYPPDSGKRVRTWNILRRLAGRHHVSLLCYGDDENKHAEALRRAGIRVHTVRPLRSPRRLELYLRLAANCLSLYPYSVTKHYTHRFRRRLRGLLRDQSFDLVHYEWSPYARYAEAAAQVPRVIMAHNVESEIWLRRARQSDTLFERLFFTLQSKKMERFERQVLSDAECVAAVTARDVEQLQAWGVPLALLVENGVDLDEFVPSPEAVAADEILCLGALDWYPNLDAVQYLLDQIYPHVLAHRPGTKLRIVGRCAPPGLRRRVAGLPGIELVDEVPDVRPHLGRATVVVVPLRIGGGSRIKILEALAMRKAVITSSVGAEGLELQSGTHLVVEDSAPQFALKTVEVLVSATERRRLGENGHKLVASRYSWDHAADAMDRAWRAAAGPAPSKDFQGADPEAGD